MPAQRSPQRAWKAYRDVWLPWIRCSLRVWVAWLCSVAASPAPIPLRVALPPYLIKLLGPTLRAEFEKKYQAHLHLLPLRHVVAPTKSGSLKLDVIVGEYYANMGPVLQKHALSPLPSLPKLHRLPETWKNKYCWPICYAQLAFIYDSRRIKQPPKSLADLSKHPGKILIMDPRTSNFGRALLCWVQRSYGTQAQAWWRRMRSRIRAAAPGLEAAHALFLRGEADFVLAHTTSAWYHKHVGTNSHLRTAYFPAGHYTTYRVAAIARDTRYKKRALQLLQLLLSPVIQRRLMKGDAVFPVIPQCQAFDYPTPCRSMPSYTPREVAQHFPIWCRMWCNALY